MDLIADIYDLFVNLDENLLELVREYGVWTYVILFTVIFCETGLVVAPFLPGDSMIFVIGALSANGELNLPVISIFLIMAAILGDTANYHIGKYLGPKVFHKDNVRYFKKEYLVMTHEFYEKHGGKTIIVARFIPIIRTFAPFVAGMGKMGYRRFISYNITGAVLWVVLFITAGYFFGNIPFVKENFSVVVFAIIFLSYLPGIISIINRNRTKVTEERN